MAKLSPFHAICYADGGQSRLRESFEGVDAKAWRLLTQGDPLHPLNLRGAPHPPSLLRGWLTGGQALKEEAPALHVLELEPLPLERVYRPALRFLLGLGGKDAELLPLEEGSAGTRVPSVRPVEALVADDHRVLLQLLDEAIENVSPLREVRLEHWTQRLYRLEPSPFTRRIGAALEESPIRPLAPLSRELPSLLAVAPLSDPGLRLKPLHRAIKGLPTFQVGRFLTLVREYARIYDVDARLDTARGLATARERLAVLAAGYHAVLLVLPGGEGKILRFRQALDLSHLRAAPKSPTLRSLDLALLNALVLGTVLGIEQPDQPGHRQVFTVDRLEELVAGVEAETFQAGFALNPPPVWELRAVMAATQQLPPHTLRLEPAVPEGAVFYDPENP